MTPEKIALIRSSFALVRPHAELAASTFYGRLFEVAPQLRMMFKGDMKEQGRKLMMVLSVVVSNLDRLDSIVPTVQSLGRRHKDYGVEDSHYDIVGAALLWTLETCLAKVFTPATRAAWADAYDLLAQVMRAAAATSATQVAAA